MNATEWIGLGALILTVIVNIAMCAYFFGDIRRGVLSLVDRGDKTDRRLETVDVRLNDHTGRIGKIEGHLRMGE